jgi:phage terminase large subunit-like protein
VTVGLVGLALRRRRVRLAASKRRGASEALEARRLTLRAKRSRNDLLEFIKLTYPTYQVGWVHKKICKVLEQFERDVVAKKSPRLVISMPPRAGKTFITSERFPVWYMGRNPGHEVAVCSYSSKLANESSGKARKVVALPVTAMVFPSLGETTTIKNDVKPVKKEKEAKDQAGNWAVDSGSSYFAVGVGGGFTGRGANLIIIDDPIKGHEQANSQNARDKIHNWYKSDAYTRLAPGGGIIIMATRWHEDDLTGRVLDDARGRSKDRQWVELILPAIAEEDEEHRKAGEALHPSRYNEAAYKIIREDVKEQVWNALYQCRPTPAEGLRFKRKFWGRYKGDPRRIAGQAEEIMLSVDCANEEKRTAARSMVHVIGRFRVGDGFRLRLLDEWNGQVEIIDLEYGFRMMCRRWPMAGAKYIEKAANGIALIQLCKDIPGVIPINPKGDKDYPGGSKEARAQYTLRALQAGQLELPEAEYAVGDDGLNWADQIIEEHAAFPKGKYKDRVDTISQVCIRELTDADLEGSAYTDRLSEQAFW